MKVLAAAFMLTLLFSAVALFRFISIATANPAPYGTHGLSIPNATPPIITVQSPHNNTTYYADDVQLNFTVAKPSSWDSNNSIRTISYTLDGLRTTLWASTLGQEATDYYFPPTKELSTGLEGVASGKHVLQIDVHAQSKYWPDPNFMFPEYYNIDTSQTLIFTVDAGSPSPSLEPTDTPPNSEPFPATLVAAALVSIAGVGLGLLVYFKKHNH